MRYSQEPCALPSPSQSSPRVEHGWCCADALACISCLSGPCIFGDSSNGASRSNSDGSMTDGRVPGVMGVAASTRACGCERTPNMARNAYDCFT